MRPKFIFILAIISHIFYIDFCLIININYYSLFIINERKKQKKSVNRRRRKNNSNLFAILLLLFYLCMRDIFKLVMWKMKN